MTEENHKYEFTKENVKKVANGAAIAILGIVITKGSEIILSLDYGEWNIVIAGLVSIGVNAARKWLSSK